MEARGVFRRLDDLGRIVIPKEIRRQIYGNKDTAGECIELILMKDGSILLKPQKEERLTRERLLEIVRPSIRTLIETDSDRKLCKRFGGIDEYCRQVLDATREEVEEIIGESIENLLQ